MSASVIRLNLGVRHHVDWYIAFCSVYPPTMKGWKDSENSGWFVILLRYCPLRCWRCCALFFLTSLHVLDVFVWLVTESCPLFLCRDFWLVCVDAGCWTLIFFWVTTGWWGYFSCVWSGRMGVWSEMDYKGWSWNGDEEVKFHVDFCWAGALYSIVCIFCVWLYKKPRNYIPDGWIRIYLFLLEYRSWLNVILTATGGISLHLCWSNKSLAVFWFLSGKDSACQNTAEKSEMDFEVLSDCVV